MALTFETPPDVSLLTLFLKGGPGIKPGQSIPRIEASAARLHGDPATYAALCGFPAVDPLPITWPNILARGLQLTVMTAPEFPLKLAGIVHVRQIIRRYRHIRAGEPLAARCVVEGHRVVRSGGEFDVRTTVTAGDEPVWEGVTTILSRAIKGDGEKRPHPPDPRWTVQRSVSWSLPADLGRRYAAVSQDYNPIHLSPWTSRFFGFSRPIVHGWWSLARALAELDHDLPEACTVDVRFRSPIPLPSTVVFSSGPGEDGQLHFEVRRKDVCMSGVVI